MGNKKTSKASASSNKTLDRDPATKIAFEATAAHLDAIAHDDVVQVNVDVTSVVISVLAVARFCADPEVRARFALLPAKVFDPQPLGDLEQLILALSHANTGLQTARAQTTEAKLPIALVDSATEVKARMLELTEYHFKAHPRLSLEVADIKLGSGYKDLASDLTRLANIYRDERASVEKDAINYRDDDEKVARALAQRILTELGEAQSAEEKKWTNLTARSWTLVRKAYEEVQAAGRFLWRNDKAEERFPSLFVAGRSGRRRKAPVAKDGGNGGGTGGGTPVGG